MKTHSWLYRMMASFISIALLLQTVVPALALPYRAAAAQETAAAMEGIEEAETAVRAPESAGPAHPVTLSRVQSRYQAGSRVTITYTVANNLMPTHAPQISDSSAVTDTVNLLAGFVITEDVNSLRQVALTTTLTSAATYLSSSQPPQQNGNTFTWQLADIPPGGTAVLTLAVQPPPTAADFIDLDGGAAVGGVLWDGSAAAAARPALLAPDGVAAATLRQTPDADPYDEDMVWKTAVYEQDPVAAFAAVQTMTYEPYAGSLRGTRGTLWSAAGNSVDQSSLLIAMLRAAGIPARYRHGTLNTAAAQTLLADIFADAQGVAGYLPPGTVTADPLNDLDLIALAQDHWWVEAYLPGQGWTDLDPSFPQAAVGQIFATPAGDGTDRIPELPAGLRHTITLTLRMEQYTAFPIGGVFLNETVPLTATLPTAQVAGRRILLSQFVADGDPGGAVFGTRQISYQPYFGIPETNQAFLGDEVIDVITNFPLASQFTTAAWLDYEIADLDGNVETFTRPIKDMLGPDVRLNGGNPDLAVDLNSPPFLTPDEQYVSWVLPNSVPEWAYRRQAVALLPIVLEIGSGMGDVLDLLSLPEGTPLSPEEADGLLKAVGNSTAANTEGLALTGLNFARQADTAVAAIGSGLRTRLYYTSPRLFAVGTTLPVSGSLQANVDLRTTRATALVAPGQSERAAYTAQWLKGIVESQLEGAVLEQVHDVPAVTTARVFAEMENAGVAPVLIHPDETYLLDLYPFSSDGKAYMLEALLEGKSVLAPTRPVLLDGEPALAWWEIDPDTGETISVGENGLHISSITWVAIANLAEQVAIAVFELLLGKILGGVSGGWAGTNPGALAIVQLAELLEEVGQNLRELFFDIADVIAGGGRTPSAPVLTSTWSYLPAHLCPVDNCGVEQFFLSSVAAAPVPLPEMQFTYQGPVTDQATGVAALDVTASLPPGTPDFTLAADPDASTTEPATAVTFQADVDSNFDDTFTLLAYAPAGWSVTFDPNGQVTAQPPVTAAAGDHTILLVAQPDQYPLLARTAVHTVTVAPSANLTLTATPEANITIPMGPAALNDVSNQTNDSEAEIPDAAYRLDVTNFTAASSAVTLTVSGAPAGWVVLNGTQQETAVFTLDANSQAGVGLYLVPPTVPAPGTAFTMNVQVQNGSGSSDSVSIPWSMPGQAFNFLEVETTTLYVEPFGNADLNLQMTNVSNAAGSFPITATAPISTWSVSGLQSPVSLVPAASAAQTVTLTIGDAPLGSRYPLQFASSAPGSYTQYAFAEVQIVSPESGVIFEVADSCTLGDDALAASLAALAVAVVELEYWCDVGDCPLLLRDRVVDAATSAAGYVDTLTAGTLTTPDDVRAVAATLATHDDDADILADVAALSTAVSDLGLDLCEVEEHQVSARFTPYLDAILLGDTAGFTLDVTNNGTLTTTYAMTVTRPEGDLLFNETIGPGSVRSLPVDSTPADFGAFDLEATVVATGPDVQRDVRAAAQARLNVVDRFVQVTAVTADPPFVETGSSSTDLSADVVNVAGVAQASTADVALFAPDGSLAYTDAVSLTLLIGPPRSYDLGTVDTSGWETGVYTITVDLLDGNGLLIPDGSGYGFLTVGQGIVAEHGVQPQVVAPGTVTVTTIITTTIGEQTIISRTAQPAGSSANERVFFDDLRLAIDDLRLEVDEGGTTAVNPERLVQDEVRSDYEVNTSTILSITGIFTRTEQDHPSVIYTGTWQTTGNGRVSGGTWLQSRTAGHGAAFAFTGPWVSVGLVGDRAGGEVEIFLDGVSQGVWDTYRRDLTPFSVHFSGLANTNHVISMTVPGTANPRSNSEYVRLDYIDVWNGTPPPDGSFEEDDPRVLLSTAARFANDPVASGGSYAYRDTLTAWFPFYGESFTYQAFAYRFGGPTQLYVDGQYLTTVDLQSWTDITRTFNFTGFAPGLHVLQVTGYQGNATVDVMQTPGSAPFTDPAPPPGDFHRYEEDDTAFLYNGLPYQQTDQSWTRTNNILSGQASGSQYMHSLTAGDTLSMTFSGSWASVGFATSSNSGTAEIFMDGTSQGIVDLYRREDGVASFTFPNIGAGTHTLSVTVEGTGDVNFDYVDVWNGTPLPDGTFDAEDGRFYLSGGWGRTVNAAAQGGDFLETGTGHAWFPFTGDSLSFESFDTNALRSLRLYVDDTYVGTYDLSGSGVTTPTLSLDGLGSGVHVLRVDGYRGETNLNAFRTPGIAPFIQPPPSPSGFTRIEEDDTGWLYNGLPYTQTGTSWTRISNIFSVGASDGQYMQSGTAGDTAVYTINGTSFGVGFYGENSGGQVEIFIDGVSYGVVDTYRRDTTPVAAYYHGLPNTTHTISITVLSSAHPNASGNPLVFFDYLDVWDGTGLADGFYEQDDSRVLQSDNWGSSSDPAASGGTYYQDGLNGDGNLWFPFAGDSVSFQAMGFLQGKRDSVRVFVDGVPQGVLNLYESSTVTRTFSFDGFGPGLHVLTVERYQGETAVDGFATPGAAPFYQPPTFTGIVRYEDDHPALRYNGYPYDVRPGSWVARFFSNASQRSGAYSSNPGDTVSLTFDGNWVNLGMRTRSSYGVGEVFIDGVSQGLITLTAPIENPTSFQFGGLVTGTHTVSVTVVSGLVWLDYIEVWDGTPVADDFVNARMTEENGRIHFGDSIGTYSNANAIDGDYSAVTLLNANGHVWYTFVGDSFTYYAFSRSGGGTADVYIDGVYTATVDIDYDFTNTPLAFHFTDLPYGPHVVRIENGLYMRVDGFAANPTELTHYSPQVEWYDNEPGGTTGAFGTPAGMLMGIAAGDLDGNGTVEIVAPSDTFTGSLFVSSIFIYRGDGSDAGNGTPLINRIDFESGGVGREVIGSVALADLDGQPGSEIVVGSDKGMYALYPSGNTYWFTDTYKASLGVRVTPAIGNLDLDAAPEIAVNLGQTLVVYEADGRIGWALPLGSEAGMPLLVDVSGDGVLDVVAYDTDGNVFAYDYNFGTPQLLWSTLLSTTIGDVRGGPAVADLEGDGLPEIAISHNEYHTVLDKDGNVVWSTRLDPGAPGGVSVADIDGDGEIELVTGMKYDDGIGQGRLYALNADGSILWERPAYDNTSANSQSVLDVDGDGVYEIAWNGAQLGFTIFNGADGSIRFNEPLVESLTATDYPIFADVDLDGSAEIVVPSNDGIRVFGWDGVWGASRPVWNQHAYHITNINDDLSVPFSEPNSWEVHNTYRTQTTQRYPAPVYGLMVTHTAAITGVTVLSSTFSVTPTLLAMPDVRWDYRQEYVQPVITRTFVSELANVQPGEVRKVAEGTEVVYALASGQNSVLLPPLYVSAPRIAEIAPQTVSAYAGTTAVYTVTLTNPAPIPDTYSLSVAGIPAGWATISGSVPLPANSSAIVPLTVTIPSGAPIEIRPVLVDVVNGSGGTDAATAFLSVGNALNVSITPAWQATVTGRPLTYTLTITNYEGGPITYDLAATGLASVSLPASFTVAGMVDSLTFQATPPAEGPQPFTVHVTSENGPTDSANGVAEGNGRYGVTAALAPDTAVTGPGVTTPLTLTLTNRGTLPDTYDLSVTVPAGWNYSVSSYGRPVSGVTVPPDGFNSRQLSLLVSPPATAAPGNYPLSVQAQSRADGAVTAVTSATLTVGSAGVQVQLTPGSQAADPTGTVSWQLTVTNTGSTADTYDLAAAGALVPWLSFGSSSVTLAAGQSQTVPLTAVGMDRLLPQTYALTAAAVSQTDAAIAAQDTVQVTFSAVESLQMVWRPATRVVTDTLLAGMVLVVTNTGNVNTTYDFGVSVAPAGTASLPSARLLLPAGSTAVFYVPVQVAAAGLYTVTATAVSESGAATATVDGTVRFLSTVNQAPTVDAGPDQAVGPGDLVQFAGSATDPEGDALTSIMWDFGDGGSATGTLTPTHTYAAPGTYTVTLTVTDEADNVSSDTLTVSVNGGLLYIPIVFNAP